MLNPGGMAKLIHYETGDVHHFSPYAFTNVGDGVAIKQINTAIFPTGITDLEKLCDIVYIQTGLDFKAENIPGSLWQNPKNPGESGGAIPQIELMPSNALKYYKLVKETTGKELNPFDLKGAITLAWVFLAHQEKVGKDAHGNYLYRVGYRRDSIVDQQNALLKWNFDRKIFSVLDTAINYYTKFIMNKPEGTY